MAILNITEKKPNRLKGRKDKDYHRKFNRWALHVISNDTHQRFLKKTLVNWNFYKNNQWIFSEDLETFLQDESGEARNRIRFKKNLVRPTVKQYVGNAIRTSYTARARAYSKFARNRREKELVRAKFAHAIIGIAPEFEDSIRESFPVGRDEAETEAIFENTWQDNYEKTINNLIRHIEANNDFEGMKVDMAERMAISGIGIAKTMERSGEQVFDVVDEMSFFFDLTAKKKDLSDAEFMGERNMMLPSDILEQWQPKDSDAELIEKHSENKDSFGVYNLINEYFGYISNRVPVYEVYWRDFEKQEYGFVKDPYGYDFFTRINTDSSQYTDDDLIEPTEESLESMPRDMQDDLMKDKKTKIFVDVLRYCILIPKEELASGGAKDDIVLEWGKVPYQESYTYSPSNVSFPYKIGMWGYHNGEILSPIDDIIDPQRFINRMYSISESKVNNSTGSGPIIAKDAVDPAEGEEGMSRAIKNGKPVYVDISRTGSVQNTVGEYGSTLNTSDVASNINVASALEQSIQDITGVNDAMTGTGGGQELVGVTESRIMRGSLIQEPFYFALNRIFFQCYNSMVSTGKRIYADNKRSLSIAVGDDGVEEIAVTEEMALEDFRITIRRVQDDLTSIQEGNQFLISMMQLGLVKDPKVAVNLFNRGTVDDVSRELRKHWKDISEAERIQAQQNQLAAQQQSAAMQSELERQQLEQEESNLSEEIRQEKESQDKMDQIALRGKIQQERDKAKAIQ